MTEYAGVDQAKVAELHNLLVTADREFDEDQYKAACDHYRTALADYTDLLAPEAMWRDVAYNIVLTACAEGDFATAKEYFKYGSFEAGDFDGLESLYLALAAEENPAPAQ